MSGGKKKKSSSNSKNGNNQKKKNEVGEVGEVEIVGNVETKVVEVEEKSAVSHKEPVSATTSKPSVDVLDRLAPPILFFPPNVSEEYLNRFCSVPPSEEEASGPGSGQTLLADEGFPDREIPVMRRLLAMMAGIMSKASAASARTYYSRVAGSEGRRNAYFQQNLNTSVFNLFSTLSAAGNVNGESFSSASSESKDLHLTPAAAFTAKDGEPLRGYPQRLMKFWRQLSTAEQVRLVREEHAALTNAWIESRQNWCLCSHCKHRRMTISDLTDCLYQTYCEELESFIQSGGQGSTLYSPNLTNSTDSAAKMRRFLFKSLSVVGEQALLPRYNQFILRLEAFSAMAFSNTSSKEAKSSHVNSSKVASSFKSAALQASKEFLQKHSNSSNKRKEEVKVEIDQAFDPKQHLKGLTFKIMHDSDDDMEDFVVSHNTGRNGNNEAAFICSDSSDVEGDEDGHQGGIQSEDDDDLIDEETDLPIDESELMLPGGASFPLLPIGDGPVQWSESSRIECGRTVFLMFASEMFQYRLTSAYLAHQTRELQLKLIAEVEEEERLEKAKRAREEKEKKDRAEMEKKKKAAKKEKAAAKANTSIKSKNKLNGSANVKKTVIKEESVPMYVREPITEPELEIVECESETTKTELEPESVTVTVTESMEPDFTTTATTTPPITSSSLFDPAESIFTQPIPIQIPAKVDEDDDDFDPNELIEQLSKEMNRFELGRFCAEEAGPPGLAPPPGFISAGPKHLSEPVDSEPPLFNNPRPPFMYNHENYGNYQPQGGYYDPYMSVSMSYAPPVQTHLPGPPGKWPMQRSNNLPTGYSSFNAKFDPFQQHQQSPRSDGQSRFQSFFSKSIFGPSTFFSQ